jgi:hypothetical protein
MTHQQMKAGWSLKPTGIIQEYLLFIIMGKTVVRLSGNGRKEFHLLPVNGSG